MFVISFCAPPSRARRHFAVLLPAGRGLGAVPGAGEQPGGAAAAGAARPAPHRGADPRAGEGVRMRPAVSAALPVSTALCGCLTGGDPSPKRCPPPLTCYLGPHF